MIKNKEGAIELSIATIVIIVLGVSMLILGMVLVRSIMCSAVGLTAEVNEKTKSELNRLFGATGEEVVCIGEGDPAKIVPGEDTIIHCSIKAPKTAEYSIQVTGYDSTIDDLTPDDMENWIKTDSFEGSVPAGDNSPKKVIRLSIPDNAPEGLIYFDIDIEKDGLPLATKTLDFEISRVGVIKAAVC